MSLLQPTPASNDQLVTMFLENPNKDRAPRPIGEDDDDVVVVVASRNNNKINHNNTNNNNNNGKSPMNLSGRSNATDTADPLAASSHVGGPLNMMGGSGGAFAHTTTFVQSISSQNPLSMSCHSNNQDTFSSSQLHQHSMSTLASSQNAMSPPIVYVIQGQPAAAPAVSTSPPTVVPVPAGSQPHTRSGGKRVHTCYKCGKVGHHPATCTDEVNFRRCEVHGKNRSEKNLCVDPVTGQRRCMAQFQCKTTEAVEEQTQQQVQMALQRHQQQQQEVAQQPQLWIPQQKQQQGPPIFVIDGNMAHSYPPMQQGAHHGPLAVHYPNIIQIPPQQQMFHTVQAAHPSVLWGTYDHQTQTVVGSQQHVLSPPPASLSNSTNTQQRNHNMMGTSQNNGVTAPMRDVTDSPPPIAHPILSEGRDEDAVLDGNTVGLSMNPADGANSFIAMYQ
eukprot:PhM_4_TR14140/c3_g1_i1/m.104337